MARPLARVVLWIARGLWWLAWDFCVETIAWSVGWPICRVLTIGRVPTVGFGECDAAGWMESMLVDIVGLATLAGTIWALARFLHA